MKKFRIRSLVFATVLLLGSIGASVNAQTVNTNEFGQMDYGIKNYYANTIYASTQISTVHSYTQLHTNVVIQLNSTGATIYTDNNSARGCSYCATTPFKNSTGLTLAIFGCHEARGYSSVEKYSSAIF